MSRRSHGEWEQLRLHAPTRSSCSRSRRGRAFPGRADPLRPDAASPFAFFRGAAYHGGRPGRWHPLRVHVQLCGDAHLSNFGGFAAPDRRLVFSLNDFDETLPGPFEWDVKRLAASFAVAGRARASTRRRVARRSWARPARTARRCGSSGRAAIMDIWYARLDVETILERWGRADGKTR